MDGAAFFMMAQVVILVAIVIVSSRVLAKTPILRAKIIGLVFFGIKLVWKLCAAFLKAPARRVGRRRF